MNEERSLSPRQHPFGRAGITNGSRPFLHPTRQTMAARRTQDLHCAFADQIGGLDNLPALTLARLRRLASLTVHIEAIETDIADGKPVDSGIYAKLLSIWHRAAGALGVDPTSEADRPLQFNNHEPSARKAPRATLHDDADD